MSSRVQGLIVDITESGFSDFVYVSTGRWTLELQLGGGTATLQDKSNNPDSVFADTILPDDTTSTSTDQTIEVVGNRCYRLNMTSYSSPGKLIASAIE